MESWYIYANFMLGYKYHIYGALYSKAIPLSYHHHSVDGNVLRTYELKALCEPEYEHPFILFLLSVSGESISFYIQTTIQHRMYKEEL